MKLLVLKPKNRLQKYNRAVQLSKHIPYIGKNHVFLNADLYESNTFSLATVREAIQRVSIRPHTAYNPLFLSLIHI